MLNKLNIPAIGDIHFPWIVEMLINYNFILKIITVSSRHTIKICLIKQIERNAMPRTQEFPAALHNAL